MAYNYISASGVIVPDTSALQSEVEAEFKASLGQNLVVTPDSPGGLLVQAETSARVGVVDNNALLANQINPNYAGGIFLDALWALLGGGRVQSTRSTAICQVTGVAGTIITTAVRFRDTSSELWAVTSAVTLDGDGLADVPVSAVNFGPIPALAGSINQIAVGVLGLETVTNDEDATLGTLTQTDASARKARKNTIGIQGSSITIHVTSALYAVPGVRSLSFRENFTSSTITIDGIDLVAHSIYACVDGGTDEDVAFAILRKSLGCNMNGETEVVVTDPYSGQEVTVKFDRPTTVPMLARVTVSTANALVDPQSAVRTAILAYAAGEIPDEDGFVVNGSVSPFELAGAINKLYPTLYVKKVEIAEVSGSPVFSTDTLPILLNEIATITSSAITVLIE